MARTSEHTRERILAAAYGLLYQEGFARVGVDAIAAASGVTKRTLYYHFESKDALVAAVLEAQHDRALARIQGWANPSTNDPCELVDALFGKLAAWADEPKWAGSGFTRVAMELADLPGHPARVAARQHKAAVETWLAERLGGLNIAAPGETARGIMLLVEGCLSLILIHRDTSYAGSAAAAAKRLLAERRGEPAGGDR
jgi:AcrR family transcriptional regulator